MSYEIYAFLANPAVLKKWKERFPSVAVYYLREDLGLVPPIGGLGLGLRQHLPPELKSAEELPKAWGEEASQGCTVAFITASYYADMGGQHAWVWRNRQLVLDGGDIDEALRLLGVEAEAGKDEFDTVGLGRFRKSETWAAAAVIDEIVRGFDDPIPALIEALRYEGTFAIQERVRSHAAGALAERGTAAEAAIPALVQTIKTDPEYGVRLSSASALGSLGPKGAEALRLLLHTIGDEDRWGVVHSLGKMGPLGAVAVSELVKVLKSDPDWKLRQAAAEALGRIGLDARAAVPALIRALRDENEHVRYHAIQSLGIMGPYARDAIPALKKALRDKYSEARKAAAEALKSVQGADGSQATPPAGPTSIRGFLKRVQNALRAKKK